MGLFTRSSKKSEAAFLRDFINHRDGWYDNETFCDILKKERNRSNRTGLPISYIRIDLRQPGGQHPPVAESELREFLTLLIQLITENTRDYDVKHLISMRQIGILLIDTPLEGAKAFIEKISRILFQNFQTLNRERYIHLVDSVLISTYPADQISECDTIQATPVVVRDLQLDKTSRENTLNNTYRENRSIHLDWQVQTAPGGAIALTNPLLNYAIGRRRETYQQIKRLIDIVGALAGLALFSPLFLFIAAAIKLTSRGPVLFKQQRIGQFGQPFTFFKFRSMEDGCDDLIHQRYVEKLIKGENNLVNLGSELQPVYKIQFDPRVTAVGNILRKTSLDELPQFLNVLSGTMSLVGPRPPIPYEVENYKNWHLRRILEVKPGITGLWQIYGRSRTTFDDMVRLDLKYVDQQSLSLDLKILLRTIPAVLTPKNGAL